MTATDANDLWLYRTLAAVLKCRYRQKIMLAAFLGIHVPLLALIGYFLRLHLISAQLPLHVLGVALVATLTGTALTLFVLDQLLRPIVKTSHALRAYATNRTLPDLPKQYGDEAGTLMADTAYALERLNVTLAEMASFDQVTGLPNREKLRRDLGARLPHAKPGCALCVLAFRNYEIIRSAFGQQTSDALARRFARELEQVLDPGVLIGRLTADQFAFRLDGRDPEAVASRVSEVLGKLRREISIDGLHILPHLTCGIALHPEDATDAAGLINSAVSAAANATISIDSPPSFFSPNCRDEIRRRLSLEQELRQAVEREEFVLYFQPVVDTRTSRIVAAEALIRWQHPRRGVVPPAEFLPIAEASGLVELIERWVLRTASRQLREWSARGFNQIGLAVNLSATELHGEETIPLISRTLAADAVDPRRLEIEVTETVAMTDRARTLEVFDHLRRIGIGVTIDDFGTGYSNLSYLLNLPFGKLKIAREFVSGVDHAGNGRAICRALIELAHGLGITVIAEGTETLAEVRALQAMGCELFQGFHFARPMRASDFATLLRSQRPVAQPRRSASAQHPGAH